MSIYNKLLNKETKLSVIGFDINQRRIHELQDGNDLTLETTPEELAAAKKLTYTTNLDDLRACNCYIVTVPTPIDEHKRPDLTPLIKASETVGKVLTSGDIIIYESTVYPGCTEEDCVPVLEKHSGLKFNQDFYCGYSPERINPGDKALMVLNVDSEVPEDVMNEIRSMPGIFTATFARISSERI